MIPKLTHCVDCVRSSYQTRSYAYVEEQECCHVSVQIPSIVVLAVLSSVRIGSSTVFMGECHIPPWILRDVVG